MGLLDQIQKDMLASMKAKDQPRLAAIRLIKTALKKHEVDSRQPLDEAAEMKVMASLVKQRKESIEMFRKGDRDELADKEQAELAIVQSYMPAAASDADMDAAIQAAIAETGADSMKQMGLVMRAAKEKLAGKTVDGKALSDKVKARLG
ncbi:MAG: GatB/YqeY domain-containing protein [bacterium]|nr:GatB/YqeY domain-containing protein [bacterium]